jgi:cytoskeletal protein CcmA (bactofilin family)
MEMPMNETTIKATGVASASPRQTQLGKTVVLRGDLSASEDLLVEGQFEGTLSLEDHCLTVGTEGQVKAEIRGRQVVILGMVTGKVVAREKVEIRRSGRLMGDITAGAVAIEEGAYFKGSIDILREPAEGGGRSTTPPGGSHSIG